MRVLGVLGGEDIGSPAIRAWAKACDLVIAADGGIHHLESAGVMPDHIVGDMDSARSIQDYDSKLVHLDQDEHRSDLQKLVSLAEGLGATEVVLTCVHGGRMDHFLASFSVAIATDLRVRWVLPEEHGILIRPESNPQFSTGVAKKFSLIPLEGDCTVTSTGLRWELQSDRLRMGHHLSLSNETVANTITLQVSGGYLVVFVQQVPHEVPAW